MLETLTLSEIQRAAERIKADVLRTPVLHRVLENGCELFIKPENLQPIGAFKIRGAFNMMRTLPADCPGVVAHSSGNHAQAVARAGKVLGIPTYVVMPSNAPPLKRVRTEQDGAHVTIVGPDSEERKREARRLALEKNLIEVPPYDDVLIAAGQGTSALELFDDVGELDRFYAPISGGGLMAGCAVAAKALCPQVEIIAVEPEDANDTYLSFKEGQRTSVPPPQTIADGLRVRIPGENTWPVVQKLVSRVELVTDQELQEAMIWALNELRVVLEPSGAASLAVALREGQGRCGVLLSGGNVEPDLLNTTLTKK